MLQQWHQIKLHTVPASWHQIQMVSGIKAFGAICGAQSTTERQSMKVCLCWRRQRRKFDITRHAQIHELKPDVCRVGRVGIRCKHVWSLQMLNFANAASTWIFCIYLHTRIEKDMETEWIRRWPAAVCRIMNDGHHSSVSPLHWAIQIVRTRSPIVLLILSD